MGLETVAVMADPLIHALLPVVHEGKSLCVGCVIADLNLGNGGIYEDLAGLVEKIGDAVNNSRLHCRWDWSV